MKAHVHCVIVGFSSAPNQSSKRIYAADSYQEADNINPYLLDAPNVFVDSRNKPICDVPLMATGNRPADGGHLIIVAEDYKEFV